MFKRLIVLAGLLLGTSPLFAWSNPTLTYQTAISSITTTVIAVSTFTIAPAVNQVDNPQLVGRVVMEIQNIDTSANLWCVPTSTASLTSNSGVGRKISPGGSWIISIADGLIVPSGNPSVRTSVKFFCISDGAAATKAAVTQEY